MFCKCSFAVMWDRLEAVTPGHAQAHLPARDLVSCSGEQMEGIDGGHVL